MAKNALSGSRLHLMTCIVCVRRPASNIHGATLDDALSSILFSTDTLYKPLRFKTDPLMALSFLSAGIRGLDELDDFLTPYKAKKTVSMSRRGIPIII